MNYKFRGDIFCGNYGKLFKEGCYIIREPLKGITDLDRDVSEKYIFYTKNNKISLRIQFEYDNTINNDIIISINEGKALKALNLDKLGKIGIDRVELDINIDSINSEIMPNKDDLGIVIDDNGLNLLDISTGEYLNINKYRHICTNYVKDLNKHIFKYKVNICRVYNPRNCIKRYESRLEIVAPKIYNEIHNIYNVNSEYEIKCILNKLQNELDCKGIYVNLEEANIRSLEINKTFEWENSILEDEDILDYIFKVIKGSDVYNKNFDVNKRVVKVYKESVTYSISSNRIKMKIYSKSEQVLNTIGYNCRVPLCRIELTLSKSAIKSSYGTDNISILKDSVKREEVFLKNISSKLINPLINNFNKEIDIIMDKLRRYDRCNYRNLDLLYKSISNELFDIVLLGVAASTIYKDRGNNNFKRDFKRLLGHISKEHIGRYQKLEKLISSITGNDSELIYIPKNVKTVLKEVSSL